MPAEEAAQPGDRVGVEVVGRLVEQQDAAAVLARVAEQDAGQLDAAALAAGEGADGLARAPGRAGPRLAQIRAASASAAYPPSAANWSSSAPYRRTSRSSASSASSHLELLHLGQQRVQAAGGEHPVAGGDVQVAGARVLRQVADRRCAGRPARRTAGPRRPAPSAWWSCRRRCGRPGRSGRRAARAGWCRTSRIRAPARSSRPVAVIIGWGSLSGGRLTRGHAYAPAGLAFTVGAGRVSLRRAARRQLYRAPPRGPHRITDQDHRVGLTPRPAGGPE